MLLGRGACGSTRVYRFFAEIGMAGFEGMSRRRTSDFLMYGLPFMGFMIAGWYGIASVVQGKRDLKGASQGLGAVEEMDPVERMRRRYGIGREGAPAAVSEPEISSLEDELKTTLAKLDLRDFDYKPVPLRPDGSAY